MKKLILYFVTIGAAVSFASSAFALRYHNPTWRGYKLDWCNQFEHQCGQMAADNYCRSKGHIRSDGFQKWDNPGTATMTIGSNAICDPRHHRCDSFRYINCVERSRTFNNPIWRGYKLDWCRQFENQCGRPAAKAFCQSQGFQDVASYAKQNSVATNTMTIGSNAVCDPRHHRCDSFRYIRCQN